MTRQKIHHSYTKLEAKTYAKTARKDGYKCTIARSKRGPVRYVVYCYRS